MKHLLSAIVLTAAAVSLTSCNEKAKLADQLTGTWTANAERITTSDTHATTTVTRNMTLVNDETSGKGGDITGGVRFSIETGTQLSAAEIQPIAVTVEGTASINGRWEAIDDDEIVVSWDYSTLKVDVDPDAINLDYDIATGVDSEVFSQLRPVVAQSISTSLTNALKTEVFNYGKIDDIDFINGATSMKCEIGHQDFIFAKTL